MSNDKSENQEAKPFRVGKRTYQKIGEVTVGKSGKAGDDFVKLAEVNELIPEGIDPNEVHIVGNREGVQVYRRMK